MIIEEAQAKKRLIDKSSRGNNFKTKAKGTKGK